MLVSIQPGRSTDPEELREHRIRRLPILVLDLHSRCQCKCVMCDIWRTRESQELDFDLLVRNRDAFAGLKIEWVVLTGGEPLMHSRFIDICTFLKQEGVRITLLTAGMSLAKRASEVANCVDEVIISLDGPRKVHDQIRGVTGAYDLLTTGILAVLSQRPEMQIRARTTVQKTNCSALCETVDAAQELDLSGISFLAADVTSAAFNRQNPRPSSQAPTIALDASEVETLDCEIARVIKRFEREIASGYIAESAAKLRRITHHFRAHLGQRPHQAPLCNAPWVSAVLGHDGSLRPCFFHEPIGSVSNQTLETALNGRAGWHFRSSLDVERNATCQQCVCSLYRPHED
ncbi:radical SAM protein [Candidatus Korobacter versatilis]|nr:radical SAM protein [Candidatus Koribacter versatilis]